MPTNKRAKPAAKRQSQRAGASPKRARASSAKTTRSTAKAAGRRAAPRPKVKRRRETKAMRRDRAARLLAALREQYPDADCALRHGSALELLVATILSAQCTDERVNLVTPNLFRRYSDAAAFAEADSEELQGLIRSTGFFRNKTKSLMGMGRGVRDEFGGRVPDTMDELLRLPGVARKTANCVLGTWYGKNEGVVVDTHVGRLALRLGLLTRARDDKDAVRIEQELIELFPREAWTYLAHALIQHGRLVCAARKPRCGECTLAGDCPSAHAFKEAGTWRDKSS